MKKFVTAVAFAAACIGTAGDAQSVDIGKAPWSKFPHVKLRNNDLAWEQLIDRVQQVLVTKKCRLHGQNVRAFNIAVPYAVLLDGDGKAQRVLVNDMGCEPIERLVSDVAIERSKMNLYVPTGSGQPQWYADEISFILE